MKQQQTYIYDEVTSGLVVSGSYNTDSFVGDYEWTGASE
jgi:hypothetical protein